MIDHESAAAWLNAYVAAWKSYDANAIGALFSQDARYYYAPYEQPLVGRDAIVASWLEDPDAEGTYDAKYAPLAVDGDVVVANGRSYYYVSGSASGSDKQVGREFDNVFVMRFNAAGECTEFREWYMKKP